MALCCRCNRAGSCRRCACVRAGKPCTNCLPSKLETCSNVCPTPTPSADPPAVTAVTQFAVTQFLDTTETSVNTDADAAVETEATAETGASINYHPHPCPSPYATHALSPHNQDSIQCPLQEPQLPSYTPTNVPSFRWGSLNADDFSHALEGTYAEVVHWRRNNFKVPTGKSGKEFVRELSSLFSAFASASSMESIALKATVIMPILLLQKPHRRSKTKDHITCLERRLQVWKEGNLNELTLEGRTIQSRLSKFDKSMATQNLSCSFANLMFEGKTKAALDLLSHAEKGGILHLHDSSDSSDPDSPSVRDILINKHPQGQRAHPQCIVHAPAEETHSVVFDSIDANAIRSASLRTTGSAGPSGLDAHEWRRLCTAFKGASTALCSALAQVAKRLCTSYVDPRSVSSFLACRLIALDKHPGVRPIDIGDTARRIIAKAVLHTIRPDVQAATGCIQLCGGQISGIEAAVHAVRSAFTLDENEAVLLVDASNAFNTLNRQAALHNISRICPPLSTILVNTYRAPTDLFVGGDTILSQEGTTQGDPLAMPMYALATIPLIKELDGHCKQTWYADDAAAVGKITDLRDWWNKLITIGPLYGYFPNPSKTWLVTKEGLHATAASIFASTGVKVTPDGRPYLGAAIGSADYISSHVETKVTEWVANLRRLAEIATTQPHTAYSASAHDNGRSSDNFRSIATRVRSFLLLVG